MIKKIVSLRSCEDYKQENVDACIDQVLLDLGGLDKYIAAGQTVLIKPNLLAKCEPNEAVTTHPRVIEAVAKRVVALGARCIIGDSPAVRYNKNSVNSVYDTTGMSHAAHESKAELNQNFDSVNVNNTQGERLKNVEIIEVATQADAIINICKMKTHSLTGFSGCVKNLYGLIPGLLKAQTHSLFPKLKDFCNALIDLERIVADKVVLHIVDAVVGMEGPGPRAGTPRVINKIIASSSAYAADAVIVQLMNLEPIQSPLLKEATRRGLIDADFNISILGDSLVDNIIKDYKTIFVSSDSSSNVVPKWFERPFRRIFQRTAVVDVDRCKGCSKCAEHCPVKAIRMEYDKQGNLYAKIDYNKCINCFCCQELCPFHLVKIRTPIGYKWLMKKQIRRDKLAQKNKLQK